MWQIKSSKGFSLSVQPVLALGASYGSPPFHMQIEEKPSTNGGRLSALTASIHDDESQKYSAKNFSDTLKEIPYILKTQRT